MTDWSAELISLYNDFVSEGFSITVRVPGSQGTWDPEEMEYTGATDDTDYTTYAIKKRFQIKDINGTVVQQNDVLLIFPAYGADSTGTLATLPCLTSDNQILIDSVVQNVVNLKAVDPGNVPLMYEALIRP